MANTIEANPRAQRKRLLARLLTAVGATGVFWMLLVDRTWSVMECDDCGTGRDVIAYRVMGVTVYARVVEHKSPVQKLAEDLGNPCQHLRSAAYLKQRWWGLVWCGFPCINGATRIAGEDWYSSRLQAIVRSRRAAEPGLADEFYKRVILAHDKQFLETLRHSLGRTGDQINNAGKDDEKSE